MSRRKKNGKKAPKVHSEDTLTDLDPTTEVDMEIKHDPKAVQSLIREFEQHGADDDTVIEDATELRQKVAEETLPQQVATQDLSLSEFVPDPAARDFFNYQSSPDFAHAGQPAIDKVFDHYTEMMAMVRSYEKMLGDNMDLGITLNNYPELKEVRLLSVSVYRSGSVILLGMDQNDMPVNIFEKIDKISFAVTPLKRKNRSKPRGEVTFFFHDQSD